MVNLEEGEAGCKVEKGKAEKERGQTTKIEAARLCREDTQTYASHLESRETRAFLIDDNESHQSAKTSVSGKKKKKEKNYSRYKRRLGKKRLVGLNFPYKRNAKLCFTSLWSEMLLQYERMFE